MKWAIYYSPAKLDQSTITLLTAIPPQCWAPGAILFPCEAWLSHNFHSHSYPPTVWAPGAILFTCEAWWIHHFRFPSHLPTVLGPRNYIIHLRSLINPQFAFSQLSPRGAGPQGAILFTCEAWWIHHFRFPSHLPTDRPRNSWLANSLQAGDQFHIR